MTVKSALVTIAAVLLLNLPASGQDVRIPGPASEGTGKGAPVLASQTFFGCIERESDYRTALDKQRGGLVGTGVGIGNEFILTHATSGRPVGTSGSSTNESVDFQLTGPAEGNASAFIGQRVEVSGQFSPPNKENALGLRRFNVLAVRAAAGSCR